MEGSHSEDWERGIKWVRLLGVTVLCILIALLLILGLDRQRNRDEGVEVLPGLVENRAVSGGFETWVLVQNPGDEPVHVNLVLNTEAGRMALPELQGLQVAAGGRRSIPLHDYVHTYHVATMVPATDG